MRPKRKHIILILFLKGFEVCKGEMQWSRNNNNDYANKRFFFYSILNKLCDGKISVVQDGVGNVPRLLIVGGKREKGKL